MSVHVHERGAGPAAFVARPAESGPGTDPELEQLGFRSFGTAQAPLLPASRLLAQNLVQAVAGRLDAPALGVLEESLPGQVGGHRQGELQLVAARSAGEVCQPEPRRQGCREYLTQRVGQALLELQGAVMPAALLEVGAPAGGLDPEARQAVVDGLLEGIQLYLLGGDGYR